MKRFFLISFLAAVCAFFPDRAEASWEWEHPGAWAGIFVGPSFMDNDALLWRLSLQGALLHRPDIPNIAFDTGLAMNGGLSKQEDFLGIKVTITHFEVYPFARAIYMITDTVWGYGGFSIGLAHVRSSFDYHFGTETITYNVLMYGYRAGLEVGNELRFFLEPFNMNIYNFEHKTKRYFSIMAGAATSF